MDYFQREREHILRRMLDVSECHEMTLQANAMSREFECAFRQEYSLSSILLQLHEFHSNRLHQLVQWRHLLMVRWRRFCAHTSVIERAREDYERLQVTLLRDYQDTLQRAQRMASIRSAFLRAGPNSAGPSQGELENLVLNVNLDDLLIYMNHLVCTFFATRRFFQFFRVLQWYPVSHKALITPELPEVYREPAADEEDEGLTNAERLAESTEHSFHSSQPGSGGRRSLLSSSDAKSKCVSQIQFPFLYCFRICKFMY